MKVTVFVPTYNREDLLPRLYKSIIEQTYKNIEFLIIDDGSSDGTKALVDKWRKDGDVEISYHYQENGGMQIAYNHGIEKATGELFIIIDSDDFFTSRDSIKLIVEEWDTIDNKDAYGCIQGNCVFEDGTPVGHPFKRKDTDNFEMRYIDRIRGDKAMAYKTSALKEYRLPNFPKEYIIPSILHNRVAQKYKTRTLSKAIITKEFLDTGISKRKRDISKELNSITILHNELNYHPLTTQLYLWSNIRYIKHSLLQGKSLKEIKKSAIHKRFSLFPIALFMGKLGYRSLRKRQN